MIQEFLDIKETDTFPDLAARMGDFLGLEQPVPLNALLRAIEDPSYTSNLITCRNVPGFLEPLLNDPKNKDYDGQVQLIHGQANQLPTKQPSHENGHSNLDLVKKATTAFINWGKSGFSIVDETALKRREDACLSCPNLSAPKGMLQKMVGTQIVEGQIGKRLGDSVCKLCGCGLSRKIKLPSENCPDQHPTLSDMSRWEEPMP